MEEWKKVKLEKYIDVVMGQSPTGDTCNSEGKGIALLNGPSEFTELSPIPVQFTTDARKFAEKGDLLFCVRGSTTGKMNWADQQYAIGRGLAAIRHKEGYEFQPFVRGLIDFILPSLLPESTGSIFPSLSGEQLKEHELLLPQNLETQRQIADFLTKLDAKIAHNRAMNATLTALSTAIFLEKYQNTEGVGRIGDIATQRSQRIGWGDNLGEFTILSAVKTGHLVRSDAYFTKQVYSADIGNYKRVAPLAFAYNPARANIGSLGMNETGEWGAVSPIYEVFEVAEGYHFWLSLHLRQPRVRQTIAAQSAGSVRQNLKYDNFANIALRVPNAETVAEFNRLYTPLRERLKHNARENETLSQLRDKLLPKLMTGRLTIKTD